MLSEGWKLSGKHGAQVVGTASAGPVYNGREALAVRVQPENFYTMWSMEWQLTTAVREGVGVWARLGNGATGAGNNGQVELDGTSGSDRPRLPATGYACTGLYE